MEQKHVETIVRRARGPLKEAVEWTAKRAHRRQPELSLLAWLAAFGSIMRGYRTTTGARSNLYTVSVAPSGSGKDAPRRAVVSAFIEAGLADHIGGESIASDAGLLAAVQRSPGILFLMDEFGHTLRAMTDNTKAPAHIAKISQALTTLFTSSGGCYLGTEYADQKARPRVTIADPCVCIYGTTTHQQLYEVIQAAKVADGSLARFLVFDAGDTIPLDFSEEAQPDLPPPSVLIDALRTVVKRRDGVGSLPQLAVATPEPVLVHFDREAGEHLSAVLRLADRQIEERPPAERPLWARLSALTAKLALVAAVANDPETACITREDTDLAYILACNSIETLVKGAERFAAESETEKRTKRVLEIIREAGRNGIRRNILTDRTKWLPRREREEIIATLLESGRVVADTRPTLTKPAQVFMHASFAKVAGAA